MEKPGFGHSAQFAPVEWDDHKAARPGEILLLMVTGVAGGRLQCANLGSIGA